MTSTEGGTSRGACIVLTTEADRVAADRVASALIDGHVAACVTMHPVRSMYRWQGTVHDTDEVQLVVKTMAGAVDDVIAVIVDHHSYEMPEVLVLEARAGADYGAWIGEVVV